KFEDKLVSGKCTVHEIHRTNLTADMQRQLTTIFALYPDLRVMDFVRSDAGPAPQYVIAGTVHSYDQCLESNPSDKKVKVAIEVRVLDNRTGKVAFTYTSSANTTGSASSLSQTAHVVLNDLAFRVQRALIARKSATRIVSKNQRKVALQDYKVKLVQRAPAHQ
ncbi:MAG: hypothetical protein ACXVA9_07200, partial [Bdellovibrionales bacterium]